jgi:hypothetical protein
MHTRRGFAGRSGEGAKGLPMLESTSVNERRMTS